MCWLHVGYKQFMYIYFFTYLYLIEPLKACSQFRKWMSEWVKNTFHSHSLFTKSVFGQVTWLGRNAMPNAYELKYKNYCQLYFVDDKFSVFGAPHLTTKVSQQSKSWMFHINSKDYLLTSTFPTSGCQVGDKKDTSKKSCK